MNHKSNEKMDIGDLGFLIIAFIVFIINFIVKTNKEKIEAQKEKQKPAQPELPEPWEVEETLPPLPPVFQSPYNNSEQHVDVKKRKIPQLATSSQEAYQKKKRSLHSLQEGVSSLSESLYKEDEMESISYQDEGSEEVSFTTGLFQGNNTEELKKAIIYSEILNRKYE